MYLSLIFCHSLAVEDIRMQVSILEQEMYLYVFSV